MLKSSLKNPALRKRASQFTRLVRHSVVTPRTGKTHKPQLATHGELGVTFIGHSSFFLQIGGLNVVIDPNFVAEEHPDARLRAPAVETEPEEDEGGPYIIAHPAAIALATLLRRLQMHDPIARSVVQIFAPASEHGTPGVKELQQQTVAMLSFKNLPKKVFDSQLAFSLLARYGEEAPNPLEQSELRIERHLATLLALPGEGGGAPMPSLRLIQAPVFHGYSFSVWVEFDGETDLEAVESGLACAGIEVRGVEFEPPNNVGQAGQGGIAVGAIAEDRNQPGAYWFWMTADNLRLSAENALAVARELG